MGKQRQHTYRLQLRWTGNLGTGTSSYRAYSRNYEIGVDGKATIAGSSDPAFRGDPTRYNPEEMLVAALASCHLLWYLHLCADAGIIVVAYTDVPTGTMVEAEDGGGHFSEVILRPQVVLKVGANLELAEQLHVQAHHLCFIARSVNFPVRCEPICTVPQATAGHDEQK